MKKTVFLFMFFGVSALCCFANENIEASPLFPYSGLPVQTLFQTDNTLAWQQADWGLTKYKDDYKPNLVPSIVLSSILMVGGLGGVIVGTATAAIANNDTDFGAGIGLMLVGGVVCVIGTIWYLSMW